MYFLFLPLSCGIRIGLKISHWHCADSSSFTCVTSHKFCIWYNVITWTKEWLCNNAVSTSVECWGEYAEHTECHSSSSHRH